MKFFQNRRIIRSQINNIKEVIQIINEQPVNDETLRLSLENCSKEIISHTNKELITYTIEKLADLILNLSELAQKDDAYGKSYFIIIQMLAKIGEAIMYKHLSSIDSSSSRNEDQYLSNIENNGLNQNALSALKT